MAKLNAAAKATLRDAGITQAAWARANFCSDGKWAGDACGCPDDRCMDGFHHDPDEECGCLRSLLANPDQPREACRRCKGSGTEPRVGSLTARDLLYAERFTLNNVRRILAEGGVVTEEAVSTLVRALDRITEKTEG